jgi:hypothetical protein
VAELILQNSDYAWEAQVMPTQQDLQKALIDVRKAYRLLWIYQRHIVDVIGLISNLLQYSFWRWDTSQIGRIPGRATTNPFGEGEWIWSTLPLYRMSLLYFPNELDWNVQLRGQWMLEVFIESDTGSSANEDETEPGPSSFIPADQSETVLRLYAWYCTQDGSLDWFEDIWQKLDWPEHDDELTEERSEAPVRVARKSFEMSSLYDRGRVERAVNEFKSNTLALFKEIPS